MKWSDFVCDAPHIIGAGCHEVRAFRNIRRTTRLADMEDALQSFYVC